MDRAGENAVIEGFEEARPKIGTYFTLTHSTGQDSVTWHPLIVAQTKIFSLNRYQEKKVGCMASPFLPQISLEDHLFSSFLMASSHTSEMWKGPSVPLTVKMCDEWTPLKASLLVVVV